MGMVRPDSGHIFLDDVEMTEKPMFRRARLGVGYLPQEASIFRKLSVQDNIMAILETQGYSRKERKERKEEATTTATTATAGNPAEMLTAAIKALAGGVTPAAIAAYKRNHRPGAARHHYQRPLPFGYVDFAFRA